MLIISHRGNLYGPSPETENTIQAIDKAIALGFKVEIDLRVEEKAVGLYDFSLGHDYGSHTIIWDWLAETYKELYIHAKTLETANYLARTALHWFYHDTEKMTLTSYGIPWCYPGIYLKNGITVQFGEPDLQIPKIMGICTDYPVDFRNALLQNK